MFHVKHPILLAILFLLHPPIYSQAQVTIEDKPFNIQPTRKESIQKSLSDHPLFKSLTSIERDFFYWVNHLRSDPRSFAYDVIHPYLKEYPELRSKSSEDLLNDLTSQESLPLLLPDAILSSAARMHATDLTGSSLTLSHTGSKGRDFGFRMREQGIRKCAAENLYEGRGIGLEALILLLIDHGEPGYGHRKALLSPIYSNMGCSVVQRPPQGYHVFVQIFSCP
jgi:hypothetical protein